jgi:hypothetical protein
MRNFLSFIGKNLLSVQSILLWLMALVNISTGTFWFFAIAAIIVGGMQDILTEIRELRKDGKPEIF